MVNSNKLAEMRQVIVDECIGCDQCLSQCRLLQRIGEDITGLAGRGPTVEEAYACTLCGLCEAVCPSSLSVRNLFAETRRNAVDNREIDIDDYKYMFPDRELTVMSLYRELSGIHYDDLNTDQESQVTFFPGCTLLTYAPELTRAVYAQLNKAKDTMLLMDCCGLPLSQLGLQARCDDYIEQVMTRILSYNVKEMVVACPNCYHQLREITAGKGIKLLTIFDALQNAPLLHKPFARKEKLSVTIHDSCSDRFAGIFARQARKALIGKGFNITEMERNYNMTICCGSGGQVTHFDPELADALVRSRLEEAEKTKAEVLAACCMGCVLNFSRIASPLKVQHVLNLLLEIEQDYTGVKTKAKRLFTGPKGEEYWQRIMAE